MTLAYANTDTTQIVARLADTNKDDLRKLSILMCLQDTVHGLLMQKLVIQVVQLIWSHLKQLKSKQLRRVNEEDVTRHAK
ncbi:Uncharacterised protein [Mycobacteroides abscessus subsp. massiliense]|nr:Uncharacterised protein [Mycobacteroides abscessus subsp. massiliense]